MAEQIYDLFKESPKNWGIAEKRSVMRLPTLIRSSGTAAAVCAALVLTAGCGTDTVSDTESDTYGAAVGVGDGTARAYVLPDAGGNPSAIGLRLTADALDGLPDTMESYELELPADGSDTAIDHITVDWNPHGHDPAMFFGAPHFDMHFYMIDDAAVAAIDPGTPDYLALGTNYPAPQYVPQDYAPAGPPEMAIVPNMGMHWVDTTQALVPGEYDFTQILINGTWDGRWTFIEPMMAIEWMRTKSPVQEDLKLPQSYQQSGYYPTTYSVSFDENSGEYVVELGGMTMREAS
ncbi:MAG: DUF5602 domain-containing protein [Rhodococcus sp. (in: high G+C Gram-positive bacteria)]|uniref:DUF5602 domain-containing protein n=1 Tax=Rhodococcus sp. TaxID=1831 RepID=UPI003BB5C53F